MKPMTSLPEKGNKFYNTTSVGGWSWCIQGKPAQSGMNVYDNCVGHSCGRFNQVYSECTGYQGMKYPQLNCNAEDFYTRAPKIGLKVQKEPTLGGIMVWLGKGKLAGHVANVEKIYNADKVMTSESGYNHFAFKNFDRSRGSNGNWGVDAKNYTYLGCIVNPGNPQPDPEPVPPTPSPYPFSGTLKKGSYMYSAKGERYPSYAKADRAVEVLGELNGRYKIEGPFNPKIVYANKSDVVKKGKVYPFNGYIKAGAKLYRSNGKAYENANKKKRLVKVQGEVNGMYQIYCTAYTPNTVYCKKSDITLK